MGATVRLSEPATAKANGIELVCENRDVGLSTKCSEFGIPDLASMLAQAMAGKAVTAPYTLRDMADDALGLLDTLGIASAHIVGVSMGGQLAAILASGSRKEQLGSVRVPIAEHAAWAET